MQSHWSMPQTLDHLEDNIRRVIADIRPQMLEKVIENWTSRFDYIRASRGSPMTEFIFKLEIRLEQILQKSTHTWGIRVSFYDATGDHPLNSPFTPVSEEESAEDTFTRRPSMPVRSQAISLPKRRMSEISVRISTMSERESSYVRTDESSVQMSSPPATEEGPSFQFPAVPRVEEPKPSPSTSSVRYRQLQPLSLMDETSQAVKFVDSDSSEGSGKSPSTRTQPEYQESDDTSYAKAIQNAQRKRSLMNGLSSSAEEDTDKFEMGTYSEADSDTNARRPGSVRDVRRRAKSLGALRDTTRRTSYGTTGPPGVGQVSVIHNRRTDPGLLPLFPYISHIMNNRKSPNDDESTPLYSSYPSVKCDIVEYL
ncbi:uncharacterized protein TNCV_1681071 [Trichonephila clavipes]|nr:uncharacterized protein TNCV_1681071 [Trichonephila clavipes]